MKKKKRGGYTQYNPTPEEIAERAAAIREGWTEEEHERRKITRQAPVTIVRVSAIRTDRLGSFEAGKE